MAQIDGSNRSSRLGVLWAEVVDARQGVEEQRQDPRHHAGPGPRTALIQALENYLGCIDDFGYPAPHGLVAELGMHRLVNGGLPPVLGLRVP